MEYYEIELENVTDWLLNTATQDEITAIAKMAYALGKSSDSNKRIPRKAMPKTGTETWTNPGGTYEKVWHSTDSYSVTRISKP